MNKIFLFVLLMAIAITQVAFAQPAFAAVKALTTGKSAKKTTSKASKPASKPKAAKTAPASKTAPPKPAEAEAPKKDPVPELEETVSSVVEPEPEAQETNNDSYGDETAKAESSEDDDYSELKQLSSNKRSDETASRNGDGIRFGARVNFTVPRVFPMTFIRNNNEQEVFAEGGIGGGLSGFAIIPISSFHFVPEISAQYRKPINIDNPDALKNGYLTVTEAAIEVPLMFRFRYSEDNLIYLGAGLFLGIVVDLTEDPPSDNDGIKAYRSKVDYGLALELGFRINDNFSIDARGTVSAASYGIGEYLDSGDTPRLIQAQLGASYTF